jgi:predicted flap endonuclease-1-like 5' DNA nuclease
MGATAGSNIFGGIVFVLIVGLALAAIAVMIYGRYLKQRRLTGEKELIERRDAAHIATVEPTPDGAFATDPNPVAAQPLNAPAMAPAAAPPAPARLSEPAPASEPVSAPPSNGDITQLKGLGPKLATTLAELGYTRLDQIAALTPDQAADLDARLGNFQGRMARDRWIEQARLLTAGDRAAYEAAFGKLC